jgi:hypothetical protein
MAIPSCRQLTSETRLDLFLSYTSKLGNNLPTGYVELELPPAEAEIWSEACQTSCKWIIKRSRDEVMNKKRKSLSSKC